MSTRENSVLFFEIGVVVAIYVGFILPYLFLRGVFNIVFLQYLAFSILTSATVFLFYKAYTKKKVTVFFLGFTIIGTLLFSMSTIMTVSYITTETYPSTQSSNWYDDTVTLAPLESKTINLLEGYQYPNWVFLDANGTVFQLTFSNPGRLRIIVYYSKSSLGGESLGLNESFGGNPPIGINWYNVYWAPTGPIDELDWNSSSIISGRADYYFQIGVGLENLENSLEQVMLRVNYFDFAGTAQRNITNHGPLIDSRFAHLGIGLIIMAWPLTWELRKRRSSIKQSVTASA